MQSVIEAGLETLGLNGQVPETTGEQLAEYVRLLLEKNQVMNLTAIRDPLQAARLHMLDCAGLLSCPGLGIETFTGKTLIDVGTGAGFPGLPLKVMVPSLQVTLLDSLSKRVDWLEEVAQTLNLSDVIAIHARAEEQAHVKGWRDHFDFATARAVADLRILTELCLPFVRVGGRFLAMKSIDCTSEVEGAAHAIQLLGGRIRNCLDYTIPDTQVTHRVVIIEKVAPTLKGYPRRWAKIQKEPL
ncbi:MAG: 16S rRNA (guanine(527)-N(7))-methyltransferase RsmG [Lawsonibacter sp.]